ncbi:hypothetical protein DL240_00250 [Lujinxingia litoralis]|uniref:Uncharacterized protein n=1 Tax=Lujinxingia litoralis TaxID=2211119 RepID=A0A328C8C5_9DELT|nr:hypothetical protein [Lujinxingia litoralis]RAL24675.1 hypothetical protein DL240_00250 [Lujinxingia litoralis]
MHDLLRSYLKGRLLPTGRRLFALEAIAKAAQNLNDQALVSRCLEAQRLNRKTRRIEMIYRSQRSQRSKARGNSVQLDAEIGTILSAMCSVAEGHSFSSDAVAELATEFVVEVAPDGRAALTRQNFETQLADAEALLDRFDSDLAPHISELGLERHLKQLREVVPRFARELAHEAPRKLSHEEVQAAQAMGREAFASVIFLVLGTYADDADTRQLLLSEYHRQDRFAAESYRRHRSVTDVDPHTGDDIASSPDAGEPAVLSPPHEQLH